MVMSVFFLPPVEALGSTGYSQVGEEVNSFGESAYSNALHTLLNADERALKGAWQNAALSGAQAAGANYIAHGPLEGLFEKGIAEYSLKPVLHGVVQGGVAEAFGHDFEASFGAAVAGSLTGSLTRDISLKRGAANLGEIKKLASQLSANTGQITAGLLGEDPNLGRQIGENVWEYNHTKELTNQAIKNAENKFLEISDALVELGKAKDGPVDQAKVDALVGEVVTVFESYLDTVDHADEMLTSWSDDAFRLAFTSADEKALAKIKGLPNLLLRGTLRISDEAMARNFERGEDLSEKRDRQYVFINGIHDTTVGVEYTADGASLLLGGGVATLGAKKLITKYGVKGATKIATRVAAREAAKATLASQASGKLFQAAEAAGADKEKLKFLLKGRDVFLQVKALRAKKLLQEVKNLGKSQPSKKSSHVLGEDFVKNGKPIQRHSSIAPKKGPFVPDEYWNKNAPSNVTPGTSRLDHTKVNKDTGKLEQSRVTYDEFGRQNYRVDKTDHGKPRGNGHPNDTGHTDPHLHESIYAPRGTQGHNQDTGRREVKHNLK